jgi:hypothetical protein
MRMEILNDIVMIIFGTMAFIASMWLHEWSWEQKARYRNSYNLQVQTNDEISGQKPQ